MAAAKPPKALAISQLFDQLRSTFPDTTEIPRLDFVESVVFAILRENRSSSEALTALERFKADYENDFNELRVSGTKEIARKIGPVPDAESRARTIRKFLHQIFDKNYKFQIDGLNKKPFKEIRDELKNYDALGIDHHIAFVQVQCLGGHAFPVDARLLEAARRLGIVDSNADAASLRSQLEKNIPKAQILHAIALAEKFVNQLCTHDAPHCVECIFQKICPHHLELTQGVKPSAPDNSRARNKDKSKPKSGSSGGTAKTQASTSGQSPTAKSATAPGKKSAAAKTAAPHPSTAQEPAPEKADRGKTAPKAATAKASAAAQAATAAPKGKKAAKGESAPVAVKKHKASDETLAAAEPATAPKAPNASRTQSKKPVNAASDVTKSPDAKPTDKKTKEKSSRPVPKKRKS